MVKLKKPYAVQMEKIFYKILLCDQITQVLLILPLYWQKKKIKFPLQIKYWIILYVLRRDCV